MRRRIGLTMILLAMPCAALAQDDDAKAATLAKEILDKGAELFDKRDAAAMAATFLEDAQIIAFKKDSGRITTETCKGRIDIQKSYAELFKDRVPEHKSRNTVESAQVLNDDLLLIRGRFALNRDDGDAIHFVQIRVRDGNEWKIATLQVAELAK
jgi:hypothetical protein